MINAKRRIARDYIERRVVEVLRANLQRDRPEAERVSAELMSLLTEAPDQRHVVQCEGGPIVALVLDGLFGVSGKTGTGYHLDTVICSVSEIEKRPIAGGVTSATTGAAAAAMPATSNR